MLYATVCFSITIDISASLSSEVSALTVLLAIERFHAITGVKIVPKDSLVLFVIEVTFVIPDRCFEHIDYAMYISWIEVSGESNNILTVVDRVRSLI